MVHKKKKKTAVKAEAEASHPDYLEGNQDWTNPLNRDKRARIIVRNLPFANLSDDTVRKIFSDYGNIIDVRLLKKPDGKYVGCGFVEFDQKQSAAKAIVHANGKEISGRTIIVDWALPKVTFVEKVQKMNAATKIKEEPHSDEDDPTDLKDLVPFEVDRKPDKRVQSGGFDDEMSGSDDDFEDGDDDDEMDEEVEKPRRESNDVEEGKTVFVKNVPFSASNDDVKKRFESFGPVVYALICIDKLTEHSKGSAFVKFKDKESAEKCMRDSKNITLMEQPLEITLAVSRSKLEEEKKLKKLKSKDSRNLYLVREGVVMAGSPAAVTVSAADMAKRLQIEQWKTQILRNLNMFVSKTRLVVHNLPSNYDDAMLREMIVQNAPPNAVVKEARVMQNRKKIDGQGQPLSKEVGFITFTSHEDALYTLRKINNNPNVFTPSKRPVVSFSIENRQILNLKQKRMEKSRERVMGDSKETQKGLEKLNRKQRRFLRRREKLIKLRQEGKRLKKEGGNPEVAKVATNKPSPSSKPKGATQKLKRTPGVELNMPSGSQSKRSKKRKKFEDSKAENPAKKAKVSESAEDYGGVHSEPGKKLKMRSKLKLRKQAEIHKNRLKEVKKIKKVQKGIAEKKQNIRQREPGVKKGKKNFDNDGKFTRLINSYKQKIENVSFKKWYEA